jgi:hypothetical protein
MIWLQQGCILFFRTFSAPISSSISAEINDAFAFFDESSPNRLIQKSIIFQSSPTSQDRVRIATVTGVPRSVESEDAIRFTVPGIVRHRLVTDELFGPSSEEERGAEEENDESAEEPNQTKVKSDEFFGPSIKDGTDETSSEDEKDETSSEDERSAEEEKDETSSAEEPDQRKKLGKTKIKSNVLFGPSSEEEKDETASEDERNAEQEKDETSSSEEPNIIIDYCRPPLCRHEHDVYFFGCRIDVANIFDVVFFCKHFWCRIFLQIFLMSHFFANIFDVEFFCEYFWRNITK